MHTSSRLRRTLLVLAALFLSTQAAAERPEVVTSLKPLELLVRAVAGDQVTVTTLVPAGSSPHTYQLRPSERRQLASADRVFWVGPELENFLTRLLTGPDFRDRTISLGGERETNDKQVRSDHDEHPGEELHGNEHHDEEHEGHGHDHAHEGGEDPHIWLDPVLALSMVSQIAEQLKTIEGVDAGAVEDNLARFTRDLRATEADISRQLAPARNLELFTYHDAFRRFAEHYGLTIAGVLTLSPEQTPGARHLSGVQERLARTGKACLLTEPQFDRQWWDALMNDVQLPLSTWDPLAGDIEASPRGYVMFQQSLADAVLHCLPEHT